MQQQELLASLLGGDNDASSLKHRLTDLTVDYPWFGAPHYLLLQQMDKTDAGYQKLAAKTALHFSSPYLLQFRLNNFHNEIEDEAVEKGFAHLGNNVVADTSEDELLNEKLSPELFPNDALEEDIITEEIAHVNEIRIQEEVIESTPIVNPNEQTREQTPVAENKTEQATQKEEMIFEPLFASDYFASQGIKLSEQEAPTDKLGKQVKSFTDWLKTMKKLPGSQASQVMHVDSQVEQLAEKSNTDAEVITETMAEVYLQQGRKVKAAEIYHKLSLLNPSKSAFFAAKIEHLKSGED